MTHGSNMTTQASSQIGHKTNPYPSFSSRFYIPSLDPIIGTCISIIVSFLNMFGRSSILYLPALPSSLNLCCTFKYSPFLKLPFFPTYPFLPTACSSLASDHFLPDDMRTSSLSFSFFSCSCSKTSFSFLPFAPSTLPSVLFWTHIVP